MIELIDRKEAINAIRAYCLLENGEEEFVWSGDVLDALDGVKPMIHVEETDEMRLYIMAKGGEVG